MPNKEEVFVAIDPGSKGAICLLEPKHSQVAFMSTTEKPIEIYKWFCKIQANYNLRVILVEEVHSLYGMSAKSNFTFGFNLGIVTALSQSTGALVDTVQPKVWQKQLGVKKKGKEIKKEVGSIINRLYPNVNIRGPRGGLDDGKSDALAIATYAYHKYK